MLISGISVDHCITIQPSGNETTVTELKKCLRDD